MTKLKWDLKYLSDSFSIKQIPTHILKTINRASDLLGKKERINVSSNQKRKKYSTSTPMFRYIHQCLNK